MLNKQNISIGIALLFHVSGLIGLHTQYRQWFIDLTWFNLLLMSFLLVWSSPMSKHFFIFGITCFFVGMTTEIIGVNTGLLFGNYSYGESFGFKILETPLLIGVLWFLTIFSSAQLIKSINNFFSIQPNWLILSLLSATLTTFFDWILEPAAIELGFWKWDGDIPLYNYWCWWMISFVLHSLYFTKCNSDKPLGYPSVLLAIQSVFFIVISYL